MQENSDKKKGTGSLMFVQLEDLVTKFARYNDLADYSILVVSTEIGATLKVKSSIGSVATGVSYESKYDNIEFVDSILHRLLLLSMHTISGTGRRFSTSMKASC